MQKQSTATTLKEICKVLTLCEHIRAESLQRDLLRVAVRHLIRAQQEVEEAEEGCDSSCPPSPILALEGDPEVYDLEDIELPPCKIKSAKQLLEFSYIKTSAK